MYLVRVLHYFDLHHNIHFLLLKMEQKKKLRPCSRNPAFGASARG